MQGTRSLRRDCAGLVIFFIISRVIFRILGISFDCSPLEWFFQYIDPELLQTKLWESLLYLHTQPPAFNLFLGIILKISRATAPTVFSLLYMCMGLLIILLMFILLRKVGINRTISLITSTFFMITPPVILYENWLFYTYPVTLLVVLSAVLLYYYFKKGSSSILIIFFSTLCLIVLTRTLFHTLWFIGILGWLLVVQKKRTKQLALCALGPLIVISMVHLKNVMLFHQTGLSSWFGMNIAKMTLSVPHEKIQAHLERNELSSIAHLEPFRPPEDYESYVSFNVATKIPVLDESYKSTGYPNYNHIAYISISKQYLTAARYLIRKYPQHYLLSVVKAVYAYLRPCSDKAIFVNENRARISTWVTIYEQYMLGDILRYMWQTTFTNRFGQTRTVHVNFLYLLLPAIIIVGLMLARSAKWHNEKAAQKTHIYMVITCLYVTIIGNGLEMSENMRFRFLIMPFIYVFLCHIFKYFIKKTSKT